MTFGGKISGGYDDTYFSVGLQMAKIVILLFVCTTFGEQNLFSFSRRRIVYQVNDDDLLSGV